MTRPTDSSIARAFWEEMEETVEAHYTPTLHEFLCRVKRRAEVLEFTVDEICDCGYVRGSFGCDDAHKSAQKVTTSPQRVQIPAETTHVRCPKCTAGILAGKWCNGPLCPLRKP